MISKTNSERKVCEDRFGSSKESDVPYRSVAFQRVDYALSDLGLVVVEVFCN